jgi:glycerophosphoryl diester phosphodiesterase
VIGILAHRANVAGANRAAENTLPAVREALGSGWGLETDIRRHADGRFYLSHDPQPPGGGLDGERFCDEVRRHPDALIALNVKELGYEVDLLSWLAREGIGGQVFLFDMELLEDTPGRTARLFRQADPCVRLAARVSDRGESVEQALAIEEAAVIWLDEFDGPWATRSDVERLTRAGRQVHLVSPDLHGRSLAEARARWSEALAWGIHGICTDYPRDLQQVLAER